MVHIVNGRKGNTCYVIAKQKMAEQHPAIVEKAEFVGDKCGYLSKMLKVWPRFFLLLIVK